MNRIRRRGPGRESRSGSHAAIAAAARFARAGTFTQVPVA